MGSRRRLQDQRFGWRAGTLFTAFILFVAMETASGLFPDLVKAAVGEKPRWLTAACVVALIVAAVGLYIRHLRTQLERQDLTDVGQEQLERERGALVHRVHHTWSRDLGLRWNDAARLELDLEDSPSAVHDPWGERHLTTEAGIPLPSGTSLRTAYDQHNRQLLVLGAPGAGKTVQMLELVASLIEDAQSDAEAPVPVFLLLTNWRGGSLERWLITELQRRYRTPSNVTRAILTAGKFCLILDGLDEVSPEQQEECVSRINDFISADGHSHCPIAISCRISDYQQMKQRITVNGAVTVQPLPLHAVHAFLNSAGAQAQGLRSAAAADPDLARLLTTPLMLGIAVLAYAGVTEEAVHSTGTIAERRELVFDAFLKRMITRDRTLRGDRVNGRFSAVETEGRLLAMASQMGRYQVTVIYPKDPLRIIAQSTVLDEFDGRPSDRIFLKIMITTARALSRLPTYRLATLIASPVNQIVYPYLRRDFVDYCCERALLQRKGDGVAFIHKTFQDHLTQRAWT
ncbi:NACHT domain-containing protein [Streptomyces virginiae]|uniref:NACHT domain-containing protein n=1 Tax=Streptomyces virginiae TaxID=1961 RepID=UPI00344F7598